MKNTPRQVFLRQGSFQDGALQIIIASSSLFNVPLARRNRIFIRQSFQ